MGVRLLYGKSGLELDLPSRLDVTVVEPVFVQGVAHPESALSNALTSPIGAVSLTEMVASNHRVGIIFNDITRATPNQLIIDSIIHALSHVPSDQITLFNATGTHRTNTEEELRSILGDHLVDTYRIVQNDASDEQSHVAVGVSARGNEVRIHRELVAQDIKILTGFIEPHFFAGFSGGGKALMPGMAGIETVKRNHDAEHIDDPNSVWGITDGNPLQGEIGEAAAMVDGTFLVNVAMNRDQRIAAVFAGDVVKAHREGCRFVKERAMTAVSEAFDIVVSSNAGYPLDLNVYQTVKGMSAAAKIVKPGGSIVVASDCWDGIPSHGEYARLLASADSIDELLELVRGREQHAPDRWQAHVHALIRKKADVYLYTENLSPEQIARAHLSPCSDVEETVVRLADSIGSAAKICVLPEGPLTIPYISDQQT